MMSFGRFYATFVKELIQLRRDRITFATMIFIPLVQLMLFGYAINTDPKHLPTAVLIQDDSVFTRSFMAALRTSEYFDLRTIAAGEDELDGLLLSGAVQFGVQIPANFGRDLIRGEKPAILVVADATDPVATGAAIGALQGLTASVFSRDLIGPAASLAPKPAPYEVRIHRRYNPTGATRLNIVPGLMGTILTLTMLIFTALSVTRERARHDEVAAVDADPPGRDHARQDRPLRDGRRHADDADPVGREAPLRRADRRRSLAPRRADDAVHRREPLGRLHFLDHRRKPAPGDADVVLLLPAEHPALGLHVPVPRHAGMGPNHRRGAAADALPAHRARRDAQRRGLRGPADRRPGHGGVHARRHGGGGGALPADARLRASPMDDPWKAFHGLDPTRLHDRSTATHRHR